MGSLTIIRLRIRLAVNTIAQLGTFERLSFVAGLSLFVYAILFQSGIAYYAASHILVNIPGLLEKILLLLYAVLYTFPVLVGLTFGKRYVGPFDAHDLEHFPLSRGQIFVSTVLAECIDPLLILCTIIAGAPVLALSGLSAKGAAQLVLLTTLFMGSVIVTRLLYKTAFNRSGDDSIVKALLWSSLGVPAILILLILIRISRYKAMGGGPGAFMQQEDIGWLLYSPPGLLLSSIISFRNDVTISLPLCSMTFLLLAGLVLLRFVGAGNQRSAHKRYRSDRQFDFLRLERVLSILVGKHGTPFVGKDLLYYFRCDRTRLAFVVAPVAYWIVGVAARPGGGPGALTWQLFAAVVGVMTALVMASNTFAYEGSGIIRYITAPLCHDGVVRTKSKSSLLIAGATLSSILVIAVSFKTYPPPEVFLVILSALPVTLMSVLMGQYCSISFPMKVDFSSMTGQAVPMYSLVVSFVFTFCLVIPFAFLEYLFYPRQMGLFGISVALVAIAMCYSGFLLARLLRSVTRMHWERVYQTVGK